MARKIRDSALQTRTGRLALPVRRKPHFVRIGLGISLGYRRNNVGGTWVLRVANGKGGAATKAIGSADDYDDANGDDVLTFWDAQERAKTIARAGTGSDSRLPLTIRVAAEIYLDALQARNANSARDARGRLKKHFLPALGDVPDYCLDEDPARSVVGRNSCQRVTAPKKYGEARTAQIACSQW